MQLNKSNFTKEKLLICHVGDDNRNRFIGETSLTTTRGTKKTPGNSTATKDNRSQEDSNYCNNQIQGNDSDIQVNENYQIIKLNATNKKKDIERASIIVPVDNDKNDLNHLNRGEKSTKVKTSIAEKLPINEPLDGDTVTPIGDVIATIHSIPCNNSRKRTVTASRPRLPSLSLRQFAKKTAFEQQNIETETWPKINEKKPENTVKASQGLKTIENNETVSSSSSSPSSIFTASEYTTEAIITSTNAVSPKIRRTVFKSEQSPSILLSQRSNRLKRKALIAHLNKGQGRRNHFRRVEIKSPQQEVGNLRQQSEKEFQEERGEKGSLEQRPEKSEKEVVKLQSIEEGDGTQETALNRQIENTVNHIEFTDGECQHIKEAKGKEQYRSTNDGRKGKHEESTVILEKQQQISRKRKRLKDKNIAEPVDRQLTVEGGNTVEGIRSVNRRSKNLSVFKRPLTARENSSGLSSKNSPAGCRVSNTRTTGIYTLLGRRIRKNMSLYETRFQTSSADEGRIIMTNGYLGSGTHRHTSSSNSAGGNLGLGVGGSGGSVTSLSIGSHASSHDTNMTNNSNSLGMGNDLPEMNGKYYLSGSGGASGIGGTTSINKNAVNNQLSIPIGGGSGSHQLHHHNSNSNHHHHQHQHHHHLQQQSQHSHHHHHQQQQQHHLQQQQQHHLQQHYNLARSMATLCNIGNTCYLNSVVYTLRFAPQFLHNLHHLLNDLNTVQQHIARGRAKSASLGRNKSNTNGGGIAAGFGVGSRFMTQSSKEDSNMRSWSSKDLTMIGAGGDYNNLMNDNNNSNSSAQNNTNNHNSNNNNKLIVQKTSHQLVAEKLHELYQCLHRNELNDSSEAHHADTLLGAIQDVNPIFEGNQQQDAHEFLMCLLNSIRETCQTLIKSIMECPDLLTSGYIANPQDNVRNDGKMKYMNSIANNNANNNSAIINVNSTTSATSSTTQGTSSGSGSGKSSLFSRKSKWKEELRNLKNSRLQLPLRTTDSSATANQSNQSSNCSGIIGSNSSHHQSTNIAATSASSTATGTSSNSLFYLNTNDLNASTASSTTTNTTISGKTVLTSRDQLGHSVGKDLIDDQAATTTTGMLVDGDGMGDNADALLLKNKQRLLDRIRELGLNFFNEDFEGITVSTTKCLSCETITEQKETMIDIAVPVPQNGYESNEYGSRPGSFIQNSCITREYFRNENKYRCEQCIGYTEAIRSISYEVLPRLLVIQLSRFSGGMEKINNYIPTSFTLQCFCSKCCELSEGNKLHIYKLYSVITHVGATMSVGHYIAYTCALDGANEYMNCPKDRSRQDQQLLNQQAVAAAAATMSISATNNLNNNPNGNNNSSSGGQMFTNASSSGSTTTATANSSSSGGTSTSTGSSFMKKMKFGRSKQQNTSSNNSGSSGGSASGNSAAVSSASGGNNGVSGNETGKSAGVVGVRHLNGLISGSKTITNGISKLSMNISSNNSTNIASQLNNHQSGNNNTAITSSSTASSLSFPVNTVCQSSDCCAMSLFTNNSSNNINNGNNNNYCSNISNQCGNGNGLDQSEEIGSMANGNNGVYIGSNNGVSCSNNQNYHHHHHHHHQQQQHYHQSQSSFSSSSTPFGGVTSSSGSSNSNSSSSLNGGCGGDPIWYMFDDDKIKAMSQREFEELLSPSRKITITPYLLFYARFDLQQPQQQPAPTLAAQGSGSAISTLGMNNSTMSNISSSATAGGGQIGSGTIGSKQIPLGSNWLKEEITAANNSNLMGKRM